MGWGRFAGELKIQVLITSATTASTVNILKSIGACAQDGVCEFAHGPAAAGSRADPMRGGEHQRMRIGNGRSEAHRGHQRQIDGVIDHAGTLKRLDPEPYPKL